MKKLLSNVLRVEINGRHVASLGLRRAGNGGVIVNVHSKHNQKGVRRPWQDVLISSLEVDARDTFYFFHYLKPRPLKVGDVITITVCEPGPMSRVKAHNIETKRQRERQRAAYEKRMKAQPASSSHDTAR